MAVAAANMNFRCCLRHLFFRRWTKREYDVHLIGITRDGRWLTAADAAHLLPSSTGEAHHLRAGDPEATPGAALLEHGKEVVVQPVLRPPNIRAAPLPPCVPARKNRSMWM